MVKLKEVDQDFNKGTVWFSLYFLDGCCLVQLFYNAMGEMPFLKNQHERQDNSLHIHTGNSIFRDTSFQFMVSLKYLATITIITFAGTRKKVASREHHSDCDLRGWRYHVGLICSRRNRCTLRNRWHQKGRINSANIEVAFLDFNWEVMARVQISLPDWQLYNLQSGLKTKKLHVLEWPSQPPDLSTAENYRAEKPTHLTW